MKVELFTTWSLKNGSQMRIKRPISLRKRYRNECCAGQATNVMRESYKLSPAAGRESKAIRAECKEARLECPCVSLRCMRCHFPNVSSAIHLHQIILELKVSLRVLFEFAFML